jgi:hypothetical protein
MNRTYNHKMILERGLKIAAAEGDYDLDTRASYKMQTVGWFPDVRHAEQREEEWKKHGRVRSALGERIPG